MLSMCDWNVSLLLKELLLIYSFSIMMLVFTLELQIKWHLSGLTFIWLSLIHLKSVFEAFWISLLSQCKDNQKRTFESPIITNLGKYLKTIYRQPKNWLLHMPYFFGFCDNQSQNIFRPGQNQLIFFKTFERIKYISILMSPPYNWRGTSYLEWQELSTQMQSYLHTTLKLGGGRLVSEFLWLIAKLC